MVGTPASAGDAGRRSPGVRLRGLGPVASRRLAERRGNEMKVRVGRTLALAVVAVSLGACTSGLETTGATTTTPSPVATTDPSSTLTVQDIMQLDDSAPLEPGTYSIDPDLDPATPLRVVYEIPATGWSQWIGAAKFAGDGHVGVSITTVANLVSHGCRDHSWADPPVGPSVDDLATALAGLAPFRLTSPPEAVSVYGYQGKHLEMTVPNLPVSDHGNFMGCDEGSLKSWVAAIDAGEPGDAFYGYTPQELGRCHRRWGTRRRVLRLHGSRIRRRVLDPRRRWRPSDDRGRTVSRFSFQGYRGVARDPGLHTNRAMDAGGVGRRRVRARRRHLRRRSGRVERGQDRRPLRRMQGDRRVLVPVMVPRREVPRVPA